MAIDFTLTAQQRELQRASRKFAKEVLGEARKAELLATPEERFLATKPTYEAMVAAGYLRKCIPAPAGGDNAGLIDMAILAEEFYSVNAERDAHDAWHRARSVADLLGGTPDQCKRLLAPFLKSKRRATCRVLLQRTGRQRQCCLASARRGRPHDGQARG